MLIKLVRTITAVLAISLSVGLVHAEELTVSAAVSLSNAFKEIAGRYEAKHPEVKLFFNFGASGTLLQQIDKGAPVDVFASADQQTMDQAQQKKLIVESSRQNFTHNALVIIAPINSQLSLGSLADLHQAAIKRVAIGNPAYVPAGNYTEQALKDAKQWKGLTDKLINAQNVRQVLDYVSRGEVDVGFVYASDAAIMQDKVKVVFQVPTKRPVSYPIALVANTKQQAVAQDFIHYILSDEAQQILVKYGFQQK